MMSAQGYNTDYDHSNSKFYDYDNSNSKYYHGSDVNNQGDDEHSYSYATPQGTTFQNSPNSVNLETFHLRGGYYPPSATMNNGYSSYGMPQQHHHPGGDILPLPPRQHYYSQPQAGQYGWPTDVQGRVIQPHVPSYTVTPLQSAVMFVKTNPRATLYSIEDMITQVVRVDESTSRFVQRRIKVGDADEQNLALSASLSSLEELVVHPYGNFLFQALLEFGSPDIKIRLMDAFYEIGIGTICLNSYGCRVIQKALRCLEPEGVYRLVDSFQIVRFVHDPNGNHVIQRCIQVLSTFSRRKNGDPIATEKLQFVIDAIIEEILPFSCHRYGCRVVQRSIEHSAKAQKNAVLEAITLVNSKLINDQYGNYVLQKLIVCGEEHHLDTVLNTIINEEGVPSLFELAKQKYSSNVVEGLIVGVKTHHRAKFFAKMLENPDGIIDLAKHPIANYVVSKSIGNAEGDQKQEFFDIISARRHELVSFPYAKYVLQSFDKLNKELANSKIPRTVTTTAVHPSSPLNKDTPPS